MRDNMRSRKFILDGQYESVFRANGIKVEEGLRKAELPGDLFRRRRPMLTAEQFFSFLNAAESLAGDPALPVRLGTAERIEAFSPPIFAAYCSRDGIACVQRLAEYKRLVGPVRYQMTEDGDLAQIVFTAADGGPLPPFLAKTEAIFLLHILRTATKEHILPVAVALREPGDVAALEDYLGWGIEQSETDGVTLFLNDLRIPFISHNETMWDFFAPELNRRLHELDVDDSVAARVRSALIELLPGGEGSTDGVARKLGLSRRTLQRKLEDEGTTFQQQLNHTRELLAKHYLRNTKLPMESISYLLGYKELNSFLRAFLIWTGTSAGEYRKTNQQRTEEKHK